MAYTQHFRLDDEQRAIVQSCLKKEKVELQTGKFDELIGNIEKYMSDFRRLYFTETDREARDSLRAIYYLANDKDPSPAQLLARLKTMPPRALEYLDGRARLSIPKLFPGEIADEGFLKWAENTKDDEFLSRTEKLLRAAVGVSSEGAQMVQGRSRGAGKRSRERPEPAIMGTVRGANDQKSKGGRPEAIEQYRLVTRLAQYWEQATNEMPRSGRSDKTGFGDLVHSVFQWLDLSTGEAPNALRHFWTEVARLSGNRTE